MVCAGDAASVISVASLWFRVARFLSSSFGVVLILFPVHLYANSKTDLAPMTRRFFGSVCYREDVSFTPRSCTRAYFRCPYTFRAFEQMAAMVQWHRETVGMAALYEIPHQMTQTPQNDPAKSPFLVSALKLCLACVRVHSLICLFFRW